MAAKATRKLLCRWCYNPMEIQGHLLDSGYTATCVKCPHVIEHTGEAVIEKKAAKPPRAKRA